MYPVSTSGLLAASGAVCARPCAFYGVTLLQASAACTAILYNGASAVAGQEVEQINNGTNTSTVTVKLSEPVICNSGLYVAITGTGAKVIVHYAPVA